MLHCDLDNIQQQLGVIIEQNQETIMELERLNATNNKMLEHNQKMLQSAINTERNSALIAQYTRIAANNTSLCASIQLSNYLFDK